MDFATVHVPEIVDLWPGPWGEREFSVPSAEKCIYFLSIPKRKEIYWKICCTDSNDVYSDTFYLQMHSQSPSLHGAMLLVSDCPSFSFLCSSSLSLLLRQPAVTSYVLLSLPSTLDVLGQGFFYTWRGNLTHYLEGSRVCTPLAVPFLPHQWLRQFRSQEGRKAFQARLPSEAYGPLLFYGEDRGITLSFALSWFRHRTESPLYQLCQSVGFIGNPENRWGSR